MQLLEPSEAVEVVYRRVGRGIAERVLEETSVVDIRDLYGRLVAEPIKASIPLPPTPRSTLDGYAVSVADLLGASNSNPVRLRISGYSRIGDSRVLDLKPGECVQVDTGAVIPRGADAVVPLEDVVVEDGYAIFTYTPQVGGGLALPASDVASGDVIVHRGARGYPEVVVALASQGYRFVRASRRVRVAVLSIGDELLEPGLEYRGGAVYDSNRFYLSSIMRILGYDVLDLGLAPDDPGVIRDTLHKATEQADIIITSGGTSVGVHDHVYRILESEGLVMVRGLRVKPGKPTIVGLLNSRLVVGMPGNPRAVANITWSFLIPLLDRLGLPAYLREPTVKEVTLASMVKLDRRRRLSLPLALVESSKGALGFPVAVESYMIASLPKADSRSELEKGDFVDAGTIVKAVNYRYPEPTVIALTDTRLLDLSTLNSRIIVSIVDDARPLIDKLGDVNAKLLVSSTQLGNSKPPGYLEWSSTRGIVKVGRGSCVKVAVFKPYIKLHPSGLTVDRAETAVILLNQGYVDCAVIPEDYVGAGHRVLDVLGSEEVFLAKLGKAI